MKITYPGLGWSNKKDFKTFGHIKNKEGEKKLIFEGLWNEFGTFKDLNGNVVLHEKVLPLIPNAE